VEQFGVTHSVRFDGITTAAGSFDITGAEEADVAWSSVGQYTDLVNPCGFLTFVGAIAADGKGVMPHLVQSVSVGGIKNYSADTAAGERIMSASTAQKLGEYMAFNVTDKYGSENFPGLTVCAKTGTAQVGGDKKPNAMIAGFVDDEQYPFAFVVAVEDGGYGREVCVPILSKVLAACKAVYDR
jgi:peptidoglycan glycosyltransferase